MPGESKIKNRKRLLHIPEFWLNRDNNHSLTRWISRQPIYLQTVWISLLAFLIYGCMYGLRKPFTVADFGTLSYLGIDYKVLLIIAQVIGYAISKFAGIGLISSMKHHYRGVAIIGLNIIAEAALLMFAIVPPPLNIVFLFINGLPLGMIWGLVFSFLEGRKTTEILGTVLSISFIVSSGFVKSAGRYISDFLSLSPFQMPWVTGLVFLIPLIGFVWLLDRSPWPSAEDIAHRTKRIPMNKSQRKVFFMNFAPGIVLLTAAYIILTVYRDLRDNFSAEIWDHLGQADNPMIFTWAELPAAFLVLLTMALTMGISDNMKAFMTNHWLILSGFLTIGFSTLLVYSGMLSPTYWMIGIGFGVYLGYLPFNSLIFERMIASFGSAANAGFLIYIADSFGYLGSVSALLIKTFGGQNIGWYDFLMSASLGLSIAGSILLVASMLYFRLKYQKHLKNKLVTTHIL